MPIVSSHLWNATGFRTTLDEQWGETLEKAAGHRDPLVVRNDTYFMKMRVGRRLLEHHAPPPPEPADQRPRKGFHEAGAP